MGPLFKLAAKIHHYRLYRPWKKHTFLLNVLGRLVGRFYLQKDHTANRKIRISLQALFPTASTKRLQRLSIAWFIHMGQILLDIMFHLPNATEATLSNYVTFRNFHLLDRVLEQGKGVLIPTIHVGNPFLMIAGLVLHPKKYEIVGIGNMSNHYLFQELLKRPDLTNLYPIGTTKLIKIKEELSNHLNKNRCILIMHDFVNKKQVRVPFWMNQYPFLKHTPFSAASLHHQTGAPILPLKIHPDGQVGKVILEFVDAPQLAEITHNHSTAPKKEYYGRISTELNRILASHLRRYAHVWSEFKNWGAGQIADKLVIPAKSSHAKFCQLLHEKMVAIVEGSFEPGRDDDELLGTVEKTVKNLEVGLIHPVQILRKKEWEIDLTGMLAVGELMYLAKIAREECIKKEELVVAEKLNQFLAQFDS